jgi:CHAD domain-containing protein
MTEELASNSEQPEPTVAEVLSYAWRYHVQMVLLNQNTERSRGVPIVTNSPSAAFQTWNGPQREASVDERLHQRRVSVRRLRGYVRLYEKYFEQQWAKRLRVELRWYGDLLDEIRDLDVVADILCADESTDARAALARDVRQQQSDAHARLSALESEPRHAALLDLLDTTASYVPFGSKSVRPAFSALSKGLEPAWKRARRAFDDADRRPSARHLHQLRIAIKKFQYGTELVALVDASAAPVMSRSKALQTHLGEVHDSTMCISYMEGARSRLGTFRDEITEMMKRERSRGFHQLRGWRNEWKKLKRERRHWR